MVDADHKHDEQRDEEPVLDLEVPEDDARSVEGGIMKSGNDTINSISGTIKA